MGPSLQLLFNILDWIDGFLWGIPAILIIVLLGLYLTVSSKAVQLRRFPAILRTFWNLLGTREGDERGIHPLKAFFAAIGGAIGIGNVIVICIAIQIGGPGALFWVWVTGFFGMIIKYSEVFLGIRFRIPNDRGSYDGGPMYFLQKAFPKFRWVPILVCVLLCIYGVEILIFSEMASVLSHNWHIPKWIVISALLVLVLGSASGGIRMVGEICSALIPLFVIIFMLMGSWVLFLNAARLPDLCLVILKSAFTGHAAIGGFAGSSLWIAMLQGAARGCYSGDVGIGYASVVHSESSVVRPQLQAGLAIFGIFLDTFVICTMSMLLILVTDAWFVPMDPGLLIQTVLSAYFPHMQIFMPFLIFLLGYSTMATIFCVGLKAAHFISPRYGRKVYWVYAIVVLLAFSSVELKTALLIMSLAGVCLLIVNLTGIFLLRKEIRFDL